MCFVSLFMRKYYHIKLYGVCIGPEAGKALKELAELGEKMHLSLDIKARVKIHTDGSRR